MKKVLFVAHVVKKHFVLFHIPYVKWFKDNGYETHVCSRNDYDNKDDCNIPYCDKYYDLPFERFPFRLNNLVVYRELKKIIDSNEYDIIHCHTPVGGVLTRLAARKARKKGTKVIYTAHGFHFFRGASLINWMIYYPIEWLCSFVTDILITINNEDYKIAKRTMRAKKVIYTPGIGINVDNINNIEIDKKSKREELNLSINDHLILSIGELSKRKNHEVVIRALAKINNKNIKYVICGQGSLEKYLKNLCNELGVNDNIMFLGFRNDVYEICKVSDLFIFPSKQEGLPVALMEAMASGLPIICSNVRGNRDLIVNNNGGYLFEVNDIDTLAEKINELIEDKELCSNMSKSNLTKVKHYDIENIINITKEIYGGY